MIAELNASASDTPVEIGRPHCLRTMRNFLGTLILISAACAPIEGAPQHNELDQIATELIAWIAANTRYPTVPIPKIEVVVELPNTRIDYGGRSLIAGYNYDDKILYLKQGWSGETPQDASTLLHELLHHAQVVSGIGPTCIRERELEAYATELRYLRENHSKDWDWSPGLKATLLALPCN